MTQTRPRRRPLTHQEKLALQERKQRRREKMEESRELAKGPIDLTFCLLVMLLMAIGLVILLSASFPFAYYKENPSRHNPLYYFERQAVFAVLGTAVMLLVSKFNYPRLRGAGAAMMLVGGINWIWVGTAAGAAVGMVYVALFVIGYNKSRVIYWLDPWADAADKGYQLSQSLITIGSGGLWGLGLGKSRQKFLFLPEEHNDFIFSIVCEELGLVGAGIIMLLFAALILRGYWIALHTRDRFGTLLVVGFTTQLAVQVFLNIGVVTGLLPTTGISLPFFSYGGTALLIQLAEMGVILSVSRQMKPTKAG